MPGQGLSDQILPADGQPPHTLASCGKDSIGYRWTDKWSPCFAQPSWCLVVLNEMHVYLRSVFKLKHGVIVKVTLCDLAALHVNFTL